MAKTKTKKTTIDALAGIMTSGFKKQEKMIDNLANAMAESFKRQEKITDDKIDDLAAMTKRGFDEATKNLDVVKNDVHFLKFDVQEIKEKAGNIEKFIFQQHSPKIKELENKVKYIEEALAIDK